MDLHTIVHSNIFNLLVGTAAIVSAIAAVLALRRINTLIKKQDSNTIHKQTQKIRGNNNRQAGRDNN